MEEKNTNPIDFVIISVDGNDKQWQAEKAKYDGKTVTNANSEVRSGLIQQTQNLTL